MRPTPRSAPEGGVGAPAGRRCARLRGRSLRATHPSCAACWRWATPGSLGPENIAPGASAQAGRVDPRSACRAAARLPTAAEQPEVELPLAAVEEPVDVVGVGEPDE